MDPKAALFENILLEFNWGQKRPKFRITDPGQFNPEPGRILDTKTFKDHAALYLNWCGAMVQRDKMQKTAHFSSPAVLAQRSEWVLAILERMSADSPNHPALIVLGKDIHLATVRQQQRNCIRLNYSLYRSDSRLSYYSSYSFKNLLFL